ncbi:MAG TPA: DUF167 domain-containing protein [Candidatus Nitrosotalea sp.]|nr:DUF167 domain-containing protein [Candidatus Nitrosotalea sp.]
MPARATPARPAPALLHVRVQPRARQDEVVGWEEGTLRLRVTAAPHDGEANRAVSRLLADTFGVPISRIVLVRGATSRDKFFRIEPR